MKRMIKVLIVLVLVISAIISHIIFMVNTREGFSVGSEWIIYLGIMFVILNRMCDLYEKSKNKAKN